ncbi:hypothetical protein [Hymenobacter psychrotolerans]|uniref:Uncharacterized protein n=1 Tax=Hymenobacter psychrotolerans DSM 18569 TaxID=1121959 RepID=A0A1M7D7W4_9BACT|nr:hypothetical protein [Hymenobacter psychrotolerans]SHL75518.1 hypothetical protein SAMN02746009_03328 [Hymenobacter psychrotolerans DSM 18569]
MFTTLQFSQLIAAAWAGPVAGHSAAIVHGVLPSGHQYTQYQVSYHVGGACYISTYDAQQCPFQAIASAVAAAAAAGVQVSRHRAQHIISRTAAALCGVQLTRPGFACRARRHRVARRVHA